MLFCTQAYFLFFTGVFVAYWLLPWRPARVWLLVGASFYFYARWNHWLALIVCASTLLDYLLARGIEASPSARLRKLLLAVSLAANLGLLCYFKYANFFLRSLEDALRAAGASASLPVLRVILPVGISFYTFEAINYTVDVYRGKVRAERNLGHFLLFILFFPHLVAGPIVRARHFLPQIGRPKRWSSARAQLGVQLFLLGMVKKLAVADRMALLVDPVFESPQSYGSTAVWMAVIGYALQIYCDFSGYSDMAIGSAHLLGYKLTKNFDLPYLSANVTEFWRRWHVSLSTWLRDYLFIPLGGSRGGRWRTGRNLLLTMALGGLWHGAAWTFVAWGALHGLLLVAHRAFQRACRARPRLDRWLQSHPGTAARVALTFGAVCAGWVFFRATSFAAALTVLGRLAVHTAGLAPPLARVNLTWTAAAVLAGHLLAAAGVGKRLRGRLPAPVVGVGYAAALFLALFLAPPADKAFIYFQF
jgi:alginate O-acetyltransferase complex protein AlgI